MHPIFLIKNITEIEINRCRDVQGKDKTKDIEPPSPAGATRSTHSAIENLQEASPLGSCGGVIKKANAIINNY